MARSGQREFPIEVLLRPGRRNGLGRADAAAIGSPEPCPFLSGSRVARTQKQEEYKTLAAQSIHCFFLLRICFTHFTSQDQGAFQSTPSITTSGTGVVLKMLFFEAAACAVRKHVDAPSASTSSRTLVVVSFRQAGRFLSIAFGPPGECWATCRPKRFQRPEPILVSPASLWIQTVSESYRRAR